jgi:hypothetical protein
MSGLVYSLPATGIAPGDEIFDDESGSRVLVRKITAVDKGNLLFSVLTYNGHYKELTINKSARIRVRMED